MQLNFKGLPFGFLEHIFIKSLHIHIKRTKVAKLVGVASSPPYFSPLPYMLYKYM